MKTAKDYGVPARAICLLPNLSGLGGPASFFARFSAGLRARGFDPHSNPADPDCKVILVIAGTKRLDLLWSAKQRGIRIVQRLDGMNWVHRKRDTGLRHYLRSEYGNWSLSTIRRHFADRIVYQSRFSQEWWERVYGPIRANVRVVYNAVDLNACTPEGPHERPYEHIRIMVVEGHFGGGLDLGLANAAQLARMLQERSGQRVELVVAGDVPPEVRERLERQEPKVWFHWAGVVKREQIPYLDRSAHLFFSAEVNAPCPNSVIEALACGTPVIAFATGSLPELVAGEAGKVVPYGADPWNLEAPVLAPLVEAADSMLANLEYYQQNARARAVEHFGLDDMTEKYLAALLGPVE